MDNNQSLRAAPFDNVAPSYDPAFTGQRLGQWLREMVWERMAVAFAPGQHVLDLGCGTGEDALWLAQRGVHVTATDASHAMLAETRRKVDQAGVADRVTITQLDLNDLPHAGWTENDALQMSFDGAFSNFGPLNCVEDRSALIDRLAHVVRPGGRVALVLMGPVCPWEIVWFVSHGRLSAARRRFRHGAEARVGDSTIRVWYPSQQRLRRELAPAFRTLEVAGIGLLLPPSDMGRLVDRSPGLAERLARIDRKMARTLLWRWLNDHYLLMLERR